ncbi:MAG: hypothetical protein KIT49_09505 [Nitrospira sp.]|nr:hypothetical protein [Nitrospira sp.]
MASIPSRGNRATELRLVSLFRERGITGWRRGLSLPGKPDFVFRREHIAVFVDGCFWHGCRWHCRMPKSRQTYWEPKISRNRSRDRAGQPSSCCRLASPSNMGTLACSTRRGHRKAAAGLEKGSKTGYKGNLNTKEFEQLDGLWPPNPRVPQGKRFTVSSKS